MQQEAAKAASPVQVTETIADAAQPATESTSATGEAAASPAEPEALTDGAAPQEAAPPEKTEGDDVPSPETQQTGLTPEQQERFNRRIGKEVAKRKALEGRLNELQAQLLERANTPPPEAPAIVPIPSGAPTLANINDVQGLVTLQQNAKTAIRYAEEQLDVPQEQRQYIQLDGQMVQPDDKLLKQTMRNARMTIEDQIPQRHQFLQARNQAEQAAFVQYPFLKDKSAPEYQMKLTAYQAQPWLRNLPNAEQLVGRYIMGVKYEQLLAQQAEAKARGKPNGQRPAPKPSGDQTAFTADTSASRISPDTAVKRQQTAALEGLRGKKGVTGNEVAQFLAQKELSKNR